MTVKEVKDAIDRASARGLDALPVGYFKDSGEFVELVSLVRVVDDYAGEVIKIGLDWQSEEERLVEEVELCGRDCCKHPIDDHSLFNGCKVDKCLCRQFFRLEANK